MTTVYRCGRCGGLYRKEDLDRHAENAHFVDTIEIDFSPIPERGPGQ